MIMGWENHIVIPKLKLLVKISRHLELEEFHIEAIDRLFDDSILLIDTHNLKLSELTIKDISILTVNHDILDRLYSIDSPDTLFLYWLKSRDLDYEIASETEIDTQKYIRKGYTILTR